MFDIAENHRSSAGSTPPWRLCGCRQVCQRKLQVRASYSIVLQIASVISDQCHTVLFSLPGFSGSEDCVSMETLLAAYDEQDEDQVSRVCNSPLLKYMDNDVSVRHQSSVLTRNAVKNQTRTSLRSLKQSVNSVSVQKEIYNYIKSHKKYYIKYLLLYMK